jgi:hypothetical protein
MRHWLFHPLIFYPLAILVAALAIAASLRPQSWPREPAAVAAAVDQNTLTFAGAAFSTPAPSTQQNMTVTRDFFGNAQTLRIAVLPGQAAPQPTDQGVRILLTPDDAARLNNRPVTLELSYDSLPVNAAHGLAVSLQGAAPAVWVSQDIRPQSSTIRFELPPQTGVTAIGLRALNEGADSAFGLEITRIRITPHTSAAAGN